MMLGAEDLALDLGLGTRRHRDGTDLLFARSSLVVAAAAARRIAIDGVFPYIDDDEGFVNEVRRARELGFRGKSTFHPKQLDVVNKIFSPTADEMAYAERVVAAFEQALARGDGAVSVGGQLIDRPVVERARRLLAYAAGPLSSQ